MQPLIYPTHTLLGSNVLGPYQNAAGNNSLSPSTAHYAATSAYDFANQFGAATSGSGNPSLEAAVAAANAVNFPYGTGGTTASQAVAAAAAAAAAAASNQNANVANYAYAALAQQALPSLTAAAYQQ